MINKENKEFPATFHHVWGFVLEDVTRVNTFTSMFPLHAKPSSMGVLVVVAFIMGITEYSMTRSYIRIYHSTFSSERLFSRRGYACD